MKSTAWLPVLALIAVVMATGFSWYSSSPDREYVFDGDRGLSRPEVAEWWTIRIPVAFAVGVILSSLLIVLLRCARRRALGEGVASLAVAILGVSTLAGSMSFVRQQVDTKPSESVRPTPQAPNEVFTSRQWSTLASLPTPSTRVKAEHKLGPLRKEGIGLRGDYTGIIPFDPSILDRVSFVGLTVKEVEDLLGPPLPVRFPNSSSITYQMLGFSPLSANARLILNTGFYFEPSDTVKGQYLRFFR